MSTSLMVTRDLDKARRDLQDTADAMKTYWSRAPSDADGQMTDIRAAIEGLTRAVASVALSVERLADMEART